MKKFTAILLALVFVCCSIVSIVAIANETEIVKGDVTGNGEIDSMDYILVKRAYFETYTLTEEQLEIADLDDSDDLGSLDYILLKRIYFGTYTYGATIDEATPDEA